MSKQQSRPQEVIQGQQPQDKQASQKKKQNVRRDKNKSGYLTLPKIMAK